MMFARYGKVNDRAEYKLAHLKYNAPVMAETIGGKGNFSAAYLQAAFVAYTKLKSKHENRIQSLDDLLGI